MPIRLVLTDDHPIVLHGLQRLLETYNDLEVVASCGDGEGALEAVRSLTPDVLPLDLRMPKVGGLDVLRTIEAERLPVRTLLLTAAVSDDDVVEAVRLGARGVVM